MNLTTPYYFLVMTVTPTIIMIYCYTSIGVQLRRSAALQRLKKDKDSLLAAKNRRAQNNLLQTCVLLLVSFVVCWSVHAIGFILYTVGYFPTLNNDLYRTSLLCIIMNSCLNPYIYSVRYKEFQMQLKTFFRCHA